MLHHTLLTIARSLTVACLTVVCVANTHAADWTTYRGDIARQGAAEEVLTAPLKSRWVITPQDAPETAFSEAEGRVIEGKLLGNRMDYDSAFEPVIADGKVYYGSSVDDQLHCVDIRTGGTLWTFFTGGPIRLAPTLADGRVYFGSDDGYAYCLDASTGEKVWSLRAGPKEDWLLARGEMISRWPVRTGLLVDDGVAYFGAGIFPHEDVFLYAVNAADGSVVWKVDNISAADAGRNDLSPQGYMLATDELLIVPSGRSMPALFDRKTGEYLMKRTYSWRSDAGGIIGGTRALLADGQLYASGPHHYLAVDQQTGNTGFGWFEGRQLVVQGDDVYFATGKRVVRANREQYAVNSRERHKLEGEVNDLQRKIYRDSDNAEQYRTQMSEVQDKLEAIADVGQIWSQDTNSDAGLLTTPELVFVGGVGLVTAYAVDSGDVVWSADVEGEATALAAANGHLIVGTTTGHMYAFASGDSAEMPELAEREQPTANPFPDDDLTETYERLAEQIIAETGTGPGFGLVFDGQQGRLAYELAKRSQLEIYMVDTDAENVAKARQALADAGYYGHRVTVHQQTDAQLPYSNYFANLLVSDLFSAAQDYKVDATSLLRHVKPLGGKFILTTEGVDSLNAVRGYLVSGITRAGMEQDEFTVDMSDNLMSFTRNALPGAGDWSHQYGNPDNTAISRDTRVKGGLGVLWYGDPGPGEMVNRHDGAVGPLAVNGRLIVQGQTTIKAYDAYNGIHLWTTENEKAVRTGVFQNQNPGNLAATKDRIFHFLGEECFELDAATGETLAIHRLPEDADKGEHVWGYIAVQDDILFGTATVREEIEARSRRRGKATIDATDSIFAIDLKTGKHLWTYTGNTISHHTIAIGPEQVYFIDSSITSQQRQEILDQDKSELVNLEGEERERAEERLKSADVRMATALDLHTGEKEWAQAVDVTDCSDIGIGGGKLTLMYSDGVLILCGANANGHYWQQFVAGEFKRRRLVALSADDGYKLWSKDANYRNRPNIINDQVLAEPWMYDLHTGDIRMRPHPITGKEEPWSIIRTGHHCGMLTGCDSGMLMFRSGYTGFYDLEEDAGTRHFAGHRLGCWINAIPANGLVMIPEASAGCVCQFSIASTIVLEPREAERPWAIYSAVGAKTPVQHMSINLGAPGDRKADDGTIWLSYPRYEAYQETSLDVKLDLQPKFTDGGEYRDINEEFTNVTGTDTPWVYTSWAEGLTSLTLPLLGEEDDPATYTIRLHFAQRDEPAKFAIKLNGQTVLKELSIEAAGTDRESIVREFTDMSVADNLTIDLAPIEGTPALNAVEVKRNE